MRSRLGAVVGASLRPRYLKDGFVSPLDVFTEQETADLYSGYRDYVHRYGTDGDLAGDLRFKVHMVAHWARDIVFAPRLVAAVKDVLDTEDLLCWTSDLNVKPPRSSHFFSYHQDSTYSGHDPPGGVLTAWVALSPAPEAAGCMHLRPGSHAAQLPHTETSDPANVLVVGQTISPEHLATLAPPVAAPLQPGQASLHHWMCVHASGPNNTDQERVGLAIRYMRADVRSRRRGGAEEQVTLVAGREPGPGAWGLEPGPGAWGLEPGPGGQYGAAEWGRHREAVAREKENYFAGTQATDWK